MKNLSDPVHFTNLKKIAQSPAHYRASIGDETDTLSFRIGRLTHALLLGVQPGVKWDVYDGRRAGKEWEAWKAARPDADLFTKSEHELCKAMAMAVTRNPQAKGLLDGDFETPIEWDHETGRRCGTRGLDILNRKHGYLLDLKTAQSAHPGRFSRDALRMGYHAQCAFYRDAARSLGVDVKDVYLIAVEKKAPHVCTVIRVPERALVDGTKLCRSWMEQLIACEQSDSWPGYCQSIVELEMPDEDDGLDFGDDETEEAA